MTGMTGKIIKNIVIHNLWDQYSLSWNSLNPDVNILVGINGSGKSTVLRIISAVLQLDLKELARYGDTFEVKIELSDNSVYEYSTLEGVYGTRIDPVAPLMTALLSTFDTPIKDKERLGKNESSLDQELDFLIYQREKENPVNFTNYRLKATMPRYKSEDIFGNIDTFFSKIINPLFERTGKKIEIEEASNELIFRQESKIIHLSELSSGEKQMLIILFRLFLMEKEPYVILMDEPEISLHIEWQQKLIDVMRQVNPNCQLIISTHSPSIFGKGWMDKLQRIEELKK
ncbi:AAA family ATPase [uncultured Parabacteroides sp.]|uniref:AAA family ATPase n=1 Tax=uncultured Parabacteroides sp. TaxID=512312 RepID=UPI00258DE1CA|nr:AAA family ATPase [uncultured Parabacteroides sp.]